MNLRRIGAVLAVVASGAAPAYVARASDAEPPATMKAVRYHENGGPETLVLEDAPRPKAGDGEILVRVHAAGVNPVDAKIRSGKFGRGGAVPAIPGYDIAGVVEDVGKGVTRFKKGDEVFAYLSLQRAGAYAEFAVALESETARKPATLTFEQAAAVPLAALTAWQALVDTAKLQDHPEKQQRVLIQGGSGGVGGFAVQIARARGARVYATASTKNIETLKRLGADEAIDYTTARFEDTAKDIDIVLDTVGGETQTRSLDVIRKGGVLVSIVGTPDMRKAVEKGVRPASTLVHPDAAELEIIAGLIDDGKITPDVSQVLPMAEARRAHEQIETGHTRGKIVLRVVGN